MILKNKNFEELLNYYLLNQSNNNDEDKLNIINQLSVNDILKNNGILSTLPPFEKHPYLENIKCENNISGIMIGTFPPISYLCDTLNLPNLKYNNQIIEPPAIPYFHGNYSSLWKYAPINFEKNKNNERELQKIFIKNELEKNGIIYTDIIKYCQREIKNEKYTAEDKLLNNIIINNNLYEALVNFKQINRLYFTNSNFFGSNNNNSYLFNRNNNYKLAQKDAFSLFIKGAHDFGFKIDFALNNQQSNWININEGRLSKLERDKINKTLTTKIILKIKLTLENHIMIYQVYSAVSPAAVNRGMVRQNQCIINYSRINKIPIEQSPKKLLEEVLLSFFHNDIDKLSNYH